MQELTLVYHQVELLDMSQQDKTAVEHTASSRNVLMQSTSRFNFHLEYVNNNVKI